MNRRTFPVRSLLTALIAAGVTVSTGTSIAADSKPVAAASSSTETKYSALSKDVQILGQVLETATAPKARQGRWEHGGVSVEGLYLAGQGIVFEVHLPGAHYGHVFAAPMAPLAPLPPMPAIAFGDGEDDVDMPDVPDTEEMEAVVEEAMEAALEATSEMGYGRGIDKQTQEQLRALRDSQRKAARDYRDQQKAYADAVRKNKDMSQAERDKLKAALDKSRQSFETSQQQFRAKAEALRNEQKQQWQAKVKETEDQLLDALCSYAGSTRRLGSGEHVSLILKDASGDTEAKHKVWVIKKPDLDACATGNQTAGVLQKKAVSYNF